MLRLAALVGSIGAAHGSARADSLDVPHDATTRISPWAEGAPRTFAAGYMDAGAVYARPQMQIGYGQPHWRWFGAEVYALTTNGFFGAYAGTRASLPFLDFTMGVRDTWSYARSFLPRRAAYDAIDVDSARDERARYLTVDYELSGVVPMPGGYVVWSVLGAHVLDAPPNVDVFEEAFRVVMRPPFLADFRGGYVLALGHDERVKLGAMSETLVIPARHATVVRVGPVGSVRLMPHTEALLVLTSVVYSPDTLGLYDGSYGFLGLRYRWASGERASRRSE
jgi:hypothetical protein